jgi:hypothetical protein
MSDRYNKYKTYEEAQCAAIALCCGGKKDYLKKCKNDPKLHSNPPRSYPEFAIKGGWPAYLGIQRKFYETREAASKAAIALGITSHDDYKKKYKQDDKLHSSPEKYYPDFFDKGGWYPFLGNTVPVEKYKTWEEASAACKKIGITTSSDHKKRYKEDPKLPATPEGFFSDVWASNGRWNGYLGKQLGSLDAQKLLKRLGITDMKGYAQVTHVKLPKNPLQAYDLETFEELLTLKAYDLEQVRAYCKRKQFQELRQYKKVSHLQHLPIPFPKQLKGFVSVSSIITKLTRVEQLRKENPDYLQWIDMANKWAHAGRNIVRKEAVLFPFVIEYLIGLEQPTEPAAFFTEKHKPPLLTNFFENKTDNGKSQSALNILHEFIDHSFQKHCQDEDDDGVSKTLPGFTNKWSEIASTVVVVNKDIPDKSNKWPLAMNYVERAAKFLIPDNAKTFQDVKKIEADWFQVDESNIDKDDPNCVWRIKKNESNYQVTRHEMWSPVRTCAMFTLFSMPLRGQQICWLDSGESDPEIPTINEQGQVVWVKNDSHLINDVNKRSENQGFLRRFKRARKVEVLNEKGVKETQYEDIIGSYISTNKTNINGSGYEVAYMPPQLIKWMIRLRDWQSKYNPIDKLTPWVSVPIPNKRNKKILEAMKSQAFLFRNPASIIAKDKNLPMARQMAVKDAFSWVLYQIQDEDNSLASLPKTKSANAICSYRSDFTPHGMRVSFISAYVIDAKLPISIVAALVGHASLVMTIYYSVTTNQDYYEMLSAGYQAALAAAPARVAGLIKNKQLKLSSSDFFDSNGQPVQKKYDKTPYASLGFKDFGICPVTCSKCHEGGEEMKPNSNVFVPVRSGYLGPSNCFACRFFITGPGYIGGLKTILAEVNLEATESSKRLEKFRLEKEELEDLQYISRRDDLPFEYEARLNNIQTLYLQEINKFDSLSQDAVLVAIMAFRSGELLKDQSVNNEKKGHQLILTGDHPILGIKIDEVSEFAHMTEICQNAEFYSCSNPSRALPKRTKMLDMFALNNGFSPELFQLSDEDQLKVGNQMTSIMLSRLNGSWDDVDRLMRGSVTLKDLGLSAKEIMEPVTLALNHWTPETEHRIEVINV